MLTKKKSAFDASCAVCRSAHDPSNLAHCVDSLIAELISQSCSPELSRHPSTSQNCIVSSCRMSRVFQRKSESAHTVLISHMSHTRGFSSPATGSQHATFDLGQSEHFSSILSAACLSSHQPRSFSPLFLSVSLCLDSYPCRMACISILQMNGHAKNHEASPLCQCGHQPRLFRSPPGA